MNIFPRPVALLVFLLAALVAHGSINTALQMQLGNPSGATVDPNNQTRYLIQRAQYALDYNNTTREPNWVAWDLTTADTGASGRSNFVVDPTLPAGFYQVLTTDYSGSGYDRGHMCPSGDRTITTADNQFTFFMSNMIPQAPDNNQGVWASFETYCRTLANAGSEILIISGPSGFAGSNIASGVAIPGYTWKIAVVVPAGAGTAASRITTGTRVIAIKIPNIAGIRNNPWQNYITSAAQIETDTGYTFFTDLSAPIRAALRVVVDDSQASTGAPAITAQPSGQSAPVGGNANFSVTATGDAPLTYQWFKDDVDIAGATAATFALTGVQAADAAIYTVVVTNNVGSVTSAGAALTVSAAGASSTIIWDFAAATPTGGLPSDVTGGTVTQNNNNGTTTMLSTTSASSGYTGASSTNNAGAAARTGALVAGAGGSAYFEFTLAPAAGKQLNVTAVSFGSRSTGTGPTAYSLFTSVDNFTTTVGTGALLASSTWALNTPALSTLTGTTGTGVTFRLYGHSGTGSPAAGTANWRIDDLKVTVNTIVAPPTAPAPAIVTQPTAQAALMGGSATFGVVATGTPAPSYQWRKDGIAVPGATGATLALANVQPAGAGGYDVVVANPLGSVTSSLARLTVSATPLAPVITRQPADLVALAGRSATFSVAASSAPAPDYQWRKDGVVIAGATNATLTLASVASADAGRYSVVATNSAGSVTSAAATLAVIRRSYAGTYFGTLGSGGTFALFVNDDNTGAFLAFAPGSRTAYLSRAVMINDTGRFRFVTTTTGIILVQLSAPGTPPTAAAIDDLVIEGNIADSGAITGASTSGAPLSITGAKTADTGSAAAGFYQAGTANGSAQTLAIISAAGDALFVTQTGAIVDGGTGTVNSAGTVSVTTAGRQTIAATVSIENASLSATVTGANGAITTFNGFAANSTAAAAQRLSNLSSRTTAGSGDQVAIAGFVIAGTESKTVLVRAVGPALRGFGVTTALGAPRLDLMRNGTAAPLATNTGWGTAGNSAELANAAVRSGAFPLAAGSADSVILTTLAPGNYFALVSASDGRAGVSLVEVYDLSGDSAAQRLVNLSTRALTGTGDATLIAGVVVSGGAPKRVLIRAAGPSLAQFGVAGVLARPQLTLFSGTSIIASNAGWNASPDAAAIAEAAVRTGAFAFGATSADAALIVNLAPGPYTAQVTGVAGTTGTALIEIYELP